MSIDWDDLILSPVMQIFGEGDRADQSSMPLYRPRVGQSFQLADAVFDAAYIDVSLDASDSDNTNTKPCLGVRLALFAREPKQNDKIDIPAGGGTFLVKDVRPDGHGHARLILMGPTA